MEPSIHKYITVKRGMLEEMEQQESSGGNSIVGQQWFNFKLKIQQNNDKSILLTHVSATIITIVLGINFILVFVNIY
ncbi:hypothetical protein FRX31_022510 [Thalictrum thalictroides]|uniref:Transmembrane protein n=1 Tax=Thalictrum thalictroides TaxID=46969 RepID=A0A7J6VS30_THATH|nr:hypothetical protein FRX31_022510 [Thalictrum thalictroides]